MLNRWQIEQNVAVILSESSSPVLHTHTICKKLGYSTGNSNSKEYRAVLRVLHHMESEGKVYYWNAPREGSTWMLKLRDVKHAFPVSYKSIIVGELPF